MNNKMKYLLEIIVGMICKIKEGVYIMTNQLLAELEMANIKIKELQEELTDYKERNEKAIEYIKSYDPVLEDLAEDDYHLLEILDKKDKE